MARRVVRLRDIAALVGANCYLVVPPDREQIDAGEWVSVLMR